MRHPLIAGLLLLLAACQPLPQPFAEDRPPPGAPILTPKDGAGIEVRPVAGTPDDAASGGMLSRPRLVPGGFRRRHGAAKAWHPSPAPPVPKAL